MVSISAAARDIRRLSIRNPLLTAAATIVAGAAGALAFAPYDLYLLAPASLMALFYLWRTATPAAAARTGYLFGIGMFGAGVNWLHISINLFGGLGFIPAVVITFVLIAYMALFPALAGYGARRLSDTGNTWNQLLVLPAVWVLTEWLRTWLFTGFPWLHFGYSQIDTPLSGLAPLLGVFGVSWAVALSAGSVVTLFHPGRRGRLMAGACLLILIAGGWLVNRAPWNFASDGERSVALVQGAVPIEVKWRPEFLQNSIQTYVSLTADHWDKNIIIWPETAIPAFSSQVPDLLRQLTAEAVKNGSDFYAGFPIMDTDGAKYFNSLLLLGADPQSYEKRHLVPFGEFTPLPGILRNFAEMLNIPMSNFSAGQQEQPLLRGQHAVAGISICYEDTFGEEVIEALPEAKLLINVSNDGWFGDSAAPHQHLQMARMRAKESGRYLLRATNSGISAIIDHTGRVQARAPQFQPFVLTGNVTLLAGVTPYGRFGNWPVVLTAMAVVLLGIGRRKSAMVRAA